MKLETFFEKFDQFTYAPDAVAKMRELVLELAVQGKLVKQKPAEGDGHALLKLIHKKNPPSEIETDAESVDAELPSFPSSWATSKLGEVAEIIRGVSFPGSAKSKTRSNDDVACLRTASVQAEIDWDDLIYISPNHISRPDQWVAPNDIIISMANSYALVGKVAIVRDVPEKATFGAFLAAIRPILVEPYFLLYVLRSPRMQAAFRASSSQTTNIANISLGRMRPLPFPLPPIAEQKRIVAKVDEMMALCDQLEAQQQERMTRLAALARATLARFADAPTPDNLEFLFHKSYTITPTDLRKSILTLAVQGKLVPQDPNDEPAEVGSHGKKRKVIETVQEEEIPFPIPHNWMWGRLGNIGIGSTGKTPPTRNPENYGGDIPFIGPGQITPSGTFLPSEKYLSEEGLEYAVEALPGDVLMVCIGGSIGKSAITRERISFNQQINAVRPITLTSEFTYFAFTSFYFQEEVAKRATGSATPIINRSKWEEIPIPIPPLAEQRRIVAKVEQLMTLVDALETQLAASQETSKRLIEAVVAKLETAA